MSRPKAMAVYLGLERKNMTNIQDEYDHETFSIRATRFVERTRMEYGADFCDHHSNDIADIIFHAVTNFVYPTTSCGKDHNEMAWDYIMLHVRDLRGD